MIDTDMVLQRVKILEPFPANVTVLRAVTQMHSDYMLLQVPLM